MSTTPTLQFKVREGFVAHITTKVETAPGKTELQTNTFYGGQSIALTQEQAEEHLHKLEPAEGKAAKMLASKVLPEAPGASLGLSPEALALVEAMAAKMAASIVGAVGKSAKAPTKAPSEAPAEEVQASAPSAE